MTELRARIHERLRERLREIGGSPQLRDRELLACLATLFQRALATRDRYALLLPEMLDPDEEWQVDEPLRLSSHRSRLGAPVLFAKRRILLPLSRWLYDYTIDRFRRQHHVNRTLFAMLEELAVENARLRRDVDALRRALDNGGSSAPPSAR